MMTWVCASMSHGVIFAAAMAAGALILWYWYNRFVERILGKKKYRIVAAKKVKRVCRVEIMPARAKKAC